MKKVLISIKRNRIFKAIQQKLQAEKESSMLDNILDDLSDLSTKEYDSLIYFVAQYIVNDEVIRSSFNLDHFRKVKEARLSIK